jgi:uncharacterized protein (DUF952 family)
MIYKICPLSIWREAECQGSFSGAGIDRRDGYIHFSTVVQLRETAARRTGLIHCQTIEIDLKN